MSWFQSQEEAMYCLGELSKADIMAASPETQWGRQD